MIEIQGQRDPHKTQAIDCLCDILWEERYGDVRKKFEISNKKKFKIFLRTKKFGTIVNAIPLFRNFCDSHWLFEEWKEYDGDYTPFKPQIVMTKNSFPSRQLHLFPPWEGAKGM